MKEIQVVFLDDEENILNSLKRLFINEPFGIFTTTNHKTALEFLLENKSVKVVVSDQRMPMIQGVNFLSNIKENYPDIVRILLTGFADIQTAEDAINKGGVYRFINKPWNDEDIKSTIREAIAKFDLINHNKYLLEITQKQNQELERLGQLKSDFISNVSHELRTPLNNMNMIFSNIVAGVAGDFSSFPPKLQEYINTALKNSEKLKLMVDDLLDVFKLDAQDFVLSLKRIDFRELIEQEVNDIKIQADKKNISMKLNFSDLPQITLDPIRIGQVLRNLFSNAIKFTNTNGIIDITVRADDKNLNVTVSDTGIGIKTDDLEAIFDRFKQVEQKAYGKPSGTGLGLAICRKIIELHNGKIWAESKEGEGSIFIFTLPLVNNSG